MRWLYAILQVVIVLGFCSLILAIGTPVQIPSPPVGPGVANPPLTRPVSTMTNWVIACDDPSVSDGNPLVNPNIVNRAAQHWVQTGQQGTIIPIRLAYPTAATVTTPTTALTIQVIGRDSNGVTERLLDSSGNHALTIAVDTTNDVRDTQTGLSYTQPILIDATGNKEVLLSIKAPLAGTGITGSVLMVKTY